MQARTPVEILNSLVVGTEGVWLTTIESGQPELLRLDPSTLDVTAQVHLAAQAMVLRSDGLWLLQETEALRGGVDTDLFALVEVDRQDGHVIHAVPLPIAAPHSSDDQALLASTADALWVSESNDHVLVRIDPGDGHMTARIALSGRPEALASTATTVWIQVSHETPPLSSHVLTIDPVRGAITDQIACRCDNKGRATAMVATGRDVWFSGAEVVHIDAMTRKVTDTRSKELFGVLATDGRDAWVVDPTPIPRTGPTPANITGQRAGLVTRLARGSLNPQAGIQLPLATTYDYITSLSVPDPHTLWLLRTRGPNLQTTLIRLTLA